MTTFRGWMSVACATAALAVTAMLAVAPSARAENNGVGQRPAMGWSSWSFLRHGPTEANVEAQAKAMVTSGLSSVGYRYVNLDDFWYGCPGSQGPDVDRYGRFAIDTASFPAQGSLNGIEALARYVHGLGLKFGIYVTPGISKQAVAENTPIKGTRYTADQIATSASENNYNCGGMVGIDFSKPGAQAFINSWADQFARWGADYVKLDGVGSFDIPDVKAWSKALRQTGRPIHLELSNSLNIDDASTWQRLSNGWRTGGDIECYCGSGSYPLTSWSGVSTRFDQVADWAPDGKPGAWNDYDSIEVGNGSDDGLTPVERQTQMSLWALASSPFILGTDLTRLDPLDLSYLLNRSVVSVDQDQVDAHRIADTATEQVFTKTERSGAVVVGLFNTGDAPQVVATDAASLGLSGAHAYLVRDLWTHRATETVGPVSAEVPAHGVALLRIRPADGATAAPPLTTVQSSGPASVEGADTVTEQVTFTNDGPRAVRHLQLSLAGPDGVTVTPATPVTIGPVASGQQATTTFTVAVPPPTQPFTVQTLVSSATYGASGTVQQASGSTTLTVTGPPVQAPFATFSSAGDAPAQFAQLGDQFGIEGAGADLFSGSDDYSAIYEKGAVSPTSTITTEVTGEQALSGFAKAGIMVRNDISAAGTAPEGVVLYDSPSGGVQLEYDDNGGQYIDAVTPPNGTILQNPPVYLRLTRDGDTYAGAYSTDGSTWMPVGTATVPGQASTQDAGVFVVSHATGQPGIATFKGFSVQ
jgi:hypothetical protein